MLTNQNDKDFYDSEGAEDSSYNREIFALTQSYFNEAKPVLRRTLPKKANVLVEIGAGSCAMGILLAKMFGVNHTIYSDISEARLQRSYSMAADHFGYHAQKVELCELDMNLPFDLPSNMADIVLFNAALHHARNIWTCLAEAQRITRPGGFVVALRESMVPALWSGRRYRQLLKTPEVRAGVSENSYTVEQYLYYMRANGLHARAYPLVDPQSGLKPIKRFLPFLNGLIFSGSYILIGQKR